MLRRLGFPDASRHGALVAGIGIDALGSGVFMPMSVLYFVRTTDVAMARIGVALGIAAAVAIPLVLVAGGLVDRWGAKTDSVGVQSHPGGGVPRLCPGP